MPRHLPNGGASDPSHTLHGAKRDTFGSGADVGATAKPAHDHKNGGRGGPRNLPPRTR